MACAQREGRALAKTPDYFLGKTLVITGAASGIGPATALIFAREGAHVVCADVNEAGVKETAAAVNAKGSQALGLKVDVTSRTKVTGLMQRAIDASTSTSKARSTACRQFCRTCCAINSA